VQTFQRRVRFAGTTRLPSDNLKFGVAPTPLKGGAKRLGIGAKRLGIGAKRLGTGAKRLKSTAEEQIIARCPPLIVARPQIDGPQRRVEGDEYRSVLAQRSKTDLAAALPHVPGLE
jgi:hypothetical protein